MWLGSRILRAMVVTVVVTATSAAAADGVSPGRTAGDADQASEGFRTLSGVDALTSDDVWVSGSADGMASVRHWDGKDWEGVPPGVPGSLNALAEAAPDNVWTVGRQPVSGGSAGLIMHWNGKGWQQMTSPADLGDSNSLRSVSVISPSNVVAAGQSCTGESACLYPAIRWNGHTWRRAPRLDGIAAIDAPASSDAWAVGAVHHGFFTYTALIKHWDGSTWTRVPAPNPGEGGTSLWGVSVVSADDVWAVGESHGMLGGDTGMVSMHWDGITWTQVATPFDHLWSNYLSSVSGEASDDVWAVGGDTERNRVALTMHWDGTAWSSVDNPAAHLADAVFTDIKVIARHDAWVVGYWHVNTVGRRILMHWDGQSWTLHHTPR